MDEAILQQKNVQSNFHVANNNLFVIPSTYTYLISFDLVHIRLPRSGEIRSPKTTASAKELHAYILVHTEGDVYSHAYSKHDNSLLEYRLFKISLSTLPTNLMPECVVEWKP
ncbi:hypothetical protein GJ496_003621 [Pomphorhynchus laevis]|nr:hypothetical protein GJ496_003621 [Pomphorhynchus laevis]